jgi:hypothetical protein
MSVAKRRSSVTGSLFPDRRMRVRTHIGFGIFDAIEHTARRGPERARITHDSNESCDVCFLAGYAPGTAK